jgi:nucleotide-binding universal stress UspA family protein
VVRGVAEQAGEPKKGEKERSPEVEVTARVRDLPPAEAVEKEASKGYDLLIIGMEPTTAPKGEVDSRLSEIAGGFEGSLAIAVARGAFEKDPLGEAVEILVPITGSGSSFRGAEVALTLAKAASAPITALAIASAVAKSPTEGRHARGDNTKILREVARLAKFIGVEVRRRVGKGATQKAIQESAGKKRRCLIVFGASRRPGEPLSFGPVAAGLLEQSKHALLIVSS